MFDFTALIKAWRGEGLVSRMFKDFEEMLGGIVEMLSITCGALAGGVEIQEAREKMRALDKEVNRMERKIRRQLVEHLTARPGVDVEASLVLMSIIKDAERLGDYARNILRAADMSPRVTDNPKYAAAIEGLTSQVESLLADTRKAIAESDEDLATRTMAREDAVKAAADQLLREISADALPSSQTVTLALMAWYFRRLAAHTANIASGIVNPVEWLDYKARAAKE